MRPRSSLSHVGCRIYLGAAPGLEAGQRTLLNTAVDLQTARSPKLRRRFECMLAAPPKRGWPSPHTIAAALRAGAHVGADAQPPARTGQRGARLRGCGIFKEASAPPSPSYEEAIRMPPQVAKRGGQFEVRSASARWALLGPAFERAKLTLNRCRSGRGLAKAFQISVSWLTVQVWLEPHGCVFQIGMCGFQVGHKTPCAACQSDRPGFQVGAQAACCPWVLAGVEACPPSCSKNILVPFPIIADAVLPRAVSGGCPWGWPPIGGRVWGPTFWETWLMSRPPGARRC